MATSRRVPCIALSLLAREGCIRISWANLVHYFTTAVP